MTWSVPSPIAVPLAASAHSLGMVGIPAGGSQPAIEYVFWVDVEGRILVSRFPGLDPAGTPIGFFTPFGLTVPPPGPPQRPVPGTSRIAAVATGGFFWVAWVGDDGMVHSEQHDAGTIRLIGPAKTLGPGRTDSALASGVIHRDPAFAWVTSDGRLGVEFATPTPTSGTRLGAPGSVRPDTPIALVTIDQGTDHVLWVAADGTLAASVRGIPGTTGQWSEPAPIRDEAGTPVVVAAGDTLTATEVDGTPEAVWLDLAGALRHARFEGHAWGAARLLLAAGPARASGPVRALSDSGKLEVLFAAPGGGIGAAVPDVGPPVTLAGPADGGATGLAVCSLGDGGRAAVWMTADGGVVRARRGAGSFGAPGTGPLPTILQVDGQVRIDPAFARCDLRLRHGGAADAFWVRPDGVLGVLSGLNLTSVPLATIPVGWHWRAAAVARPGLVRTSPPGAVARLPRDPAGFALLWVQPDGSVRHIDFDGTDLVESPNWRLPAQVAPPGSAVADAPAVAATPGPAGAPPGEEWAFWLMPAGKIGVARRDDATVTWTVQTPLDASARADSTLLAGTLPGRVTIAWVDFSSGAPVFASKSADSNWAQQPAPASKRTFTVAPRGRLVAAATDAGTAARVAWIDVDGIVRAALVDGGKWSDAVQLSDPGVADSSSLSLLQADSALAWVLPDGTVVQEGQGPVTAPAAARTVLGSVAPPHGGTLLVVAMPDGNIGTLQRGDS